MREFRAEFREWPIGDWIAPLDGANSRTQLRQSRKPVLFLTEGKSLYFGFLLGDSA